MGNTATNNAASAAKDKARAWRAEGRALLSHIAGKLGKKHEGDLAMYATTSDGEEVLIDFQPFAAGGLTFFNYDDPTPEGNARAAAWARNQAGIPEPGPADDPIIRLREPEPAANDNEPQSAEAKASAFAGYDVGAAQRARQAEAAKQRFGHSWFGELKDALPKETFIKGVLGVGEHTVLSGLPGSGKSVIATDMACHVAAGMPWFGLRVKQGLVVYIAAERTALTKRRMLAFKKHHEVKDAPLLVLDGRIDLTSGLIDAKAIAGAVKAAEADCGHGCVWIVIDTLTRTFGPGDQNASQDMTRFIAACDLILKETGAHVTVIHHTPWSGARSKGAIDLDGAVDASFLVSKSGQGFAATYSIVCDGANDGVDGPVAHFSMISLEVGRDEDGEPTTAPVVVPAEPGAAERLVANDATKKATHADEALEALRTVIERGEGEAATEAAWRAGANLKWHDAAPATRKKRFSRARDALIADGRVVRSGDTFSPAESEGDIGGDNVTVSPWMSPSEAKGRETRGQGHSFFNECPDVPCLPEPEIEESQGDVASNVPVEAACG